MSIRCRGSPRAPAQCVQSSHPNKHGKQRKREHTTPRKIGPGIGMFHEQNAPRGMLSGTRRTLQRVKGLAKTERGSQQLRTTLRTCYQPLAGQMISHKKREESESPDRSKREKKVEQPSHLSLHVIDNMIPNKNTTRSPRTTRQSIPENTMLSGWLACGAGRAGQGRPATPAER